MAYRRIAQTELLECSVPKSTLRELFDIFDVEKTGFIDARELKAGMRALGCALTLDQIRDGLHSLGQKIDQPIAFDLFCAMVEPNLPRKDSMESYKQLFNSMGGNFTGTLTFHHLRQLCDELNENVSDEDLQRMIDEADLDGDGKVTFDDFVRVMKIARDPLADLP